MNNFSLNLLMQKKTGNQNIYNKIKIIRDKFKIFNKKKLQLKTSLSKSQMNNSSFNQNINL